MPSVVATIAVLASIVSTVPAYIVDPPTTAASDTVQDCSAWYVVAGDETCASIVESQWMESDDQFNSYNPSIGSDCNFISGNSYCVERNYGFPVTTLPATTIAISTPAPPTPTPPPAVTTPLTPTNGIATPRPIQTGMALTCDAFYLVAKDDGCYDIAQNYSISLDQFCTWNPAVVIDCAALWPGNYVCVSIIGIPMSSKTTLVTTARPQTSSFVLPPICRFDISKGEYVCDGTPVVTKPTITSPGVGIATPTPHQSGMVSNCKRFYKVIKGDGCWAIADVNKISQDDIYKWNAGIGSKCERLYPDEFVCIGV